MLLVACFHIGILHGRLKLLESIWIKTVRQFTFKPPHLKTDVWSNYHIKDCKTVVGFVLLDFLKKYNMIWITYAVPPHYGPWIKRRKGLCLGIEARIGIFEQNITYVTKKNTFGNRLRINRWKINFLKCKLKINGVGGWNSIPDE